MKKRIEIKIKGAVQGVGFRPFIFRLVNSMQLKGFVQNSSQGVLVDVEGEEEKLKMFLEKIQTEKPEIAFIEKMDFKFKNLTNYIDFKIVSSNGSEKKSAFVIPDIATCKDCKKEIFDKTNRRYLYPFTNCTNCGPRYTIVEKLPYDRINTTMKNFVMCEDCENEYKSPHDRRFHAQPNACPNCGPQVELWNRNGKIISKKNEAINLFCEFVREGKILALKGIGGFHLICDARNEDTVKLLRQRKHREEKPFALMFPNMESILNVSEVSECEKKILLSYQSPIVLLHKKNENLLAKSIALNNFYFGIMLPYSPLHHIIMKELNFPIVATSGNLSDEPICTDEFEAVEKLNQIADYFLVHNRPIKIFVDDSIVKIVANEIFTIRRARGYAPFPIEIKNNSKTFFAFGSQLKNTITFANENNFFVSPHIGDLDSLSANKSFTDTINFFKNIYETNTNLFVCDLHPNYSSTIFALKNSNNVLQVQHHYSHIASVMAENNLNENVLGISWDGTGFGIDETIWGGEFLIATANNFQRVATIKSFNLIGGESAIKDLRKISFSILYEIFGDSIFDEKIIPINFLSNVEKRTFLQMIKKNINTFKTTSVGRLFDGVASLLNIKQFATYEGQAAMELEFQIGNLISDEHYEFDIVENNNLKIFDWSKIVIGILNDLKSNVDLNFISLKFHNSLVLAILKIVKMFNLKKIVLSGGCFQNSYLLEKSIYLLRKNNYEVFWNKKIPINDGGISVGQAFILSNTKI